ncbi:hypothetical protein SK066_01600 [Paenibacillus hunanensis]|uniref:hypothetical protein n=1 Tax=Paenibacillus hunanensis TaxID=539262 RepID=UPI002A6A6C20|nr:hypothetical protein [Paenibacillus hunanensis]WPP41682.1 hypothetical protein SK066_01600 [Paenibacillus hunanensis]
MERNPSQQPAQSEFAQPLLAHTGTPAVYIDGSEQASSTDQKESSASLNSRRARMTAFSLLLAVPVALTACSSDDNARCEYDQNGNPYNCDNYSSSSSSSSHYYKSSSSSDSHSGFGSSGSGFSFFGG